MVCPFRLCIQIRIRNIINALLPYADLLKQVLSVHIHLAYQKPHWALFPLLYLQLPCVVILPICHYFDKANSDRAQLLTHDSSMFLKQQRSAAPIQETWQCQR